MTLCPQTLWMGHLERTGSLTDTLSVDTLARDTLAGDTWARDILASGTLAKDMTLWPVWPETLWPEYFLVALRRKLHFQVALRRR